jgi:hypothetical protein
MKILSIQCLLRSINFHGQLGDLELKLTVTSPYGQTMLMTNLELTNGNKGHSPN